MVTVYKDEGRVKTEVSYAVFLTPRVGQSRGLRTKSSEHHACLICDGANRSTTHLCGHNCDHDVCCEHPAGGPVRKWENALCVFPRCSRTVFCTGQSGCEGAQSD